jgi:hypothetical protein
MQVTAYEGVIENGQVRLFADVSLPDNTRVYVIVPGVEPPKTVYVYRPRLARPEQAVDFIKEVAEDVPNASL